MTPEPPDLASVNRALHWCAFVLGVSLLILVIDLQLKRSIARTAVIAAGRHDSIMKLADLIVGDLRKGRPGGQTASGVGAAGDAGPDSRADVVADPGLAASDDHPGGPAPGIQDPAPAGPVKRQAGNGPRARRQAGS